MTDDPKRRRGRPELPDDERKVLTLTARMTTEEREELDSAADRAGKKLSDWIRLTLMAVARPPVKPPVKREPNTLHFWDDEGVVYVQTPIQMSHEMWGKLKKYVDVIEPREV